MRCLWFDVFREFPNKIFQILTKRPGLALLFHRNYPLPENCWFGVSCGIKQAKHRLDIARKVSSKIRFVSVEPLLEDLGGLNLEGIHWVIIGGESGRNPRPMKKEWVDSIIKQCREQGARVFFKQWGGIGGDGSGGCLYEGKTIKEFPN